MKRFTRRYLSLAFTLLLLLTSSLPVNAEVIEDADVPTAKMEWDETVGTCAMFLAIYSDVRTIAVPIEDASIVEIVNGAIGVVTWPNGNCATQTPEFTTDPATLNKMRLSSLATQLGFDIYPMSSSVPDSEFYVLPENLPDGEYSYGIECRVADADWWITRGQSGLSRVAELPTTGAESGEILNIRESATGLKMIVISLD